MRCQDHLSCSCCDRRSNFFDDQMHRSGIETIFNLFDNQQRGRIGMPQTGKQGNDAKSSSGKGPTGNLVFDFGEFQIGAAFDGIGDSGLQISGIRDNESYCLQQIFVRIKTCIPQ